MQPPANLDPNTTTASSMRPELKPASPKTAAIGFVFSLTLASSLHPDFDLYYRKLTLPPINCVGAGSTLTVSIIREALLPDPAIDPFDALLKEVHTQVSEEGWAKMPANFSSSVDGLVYGT